MVLYVIYALQQFGAISITPSTQEVLS